MAIVPLGVPAVVGQDTDLTLSIFNVRKYGAKGNAVDNDALAINTAIQDAVAAGGGIVYFPAGTYKVNSTIIVPPGFFNTIRLVGQGMRDSYIYPGVNGMIAVLFGTSTPDPSGTSTNNLQYCGMEHLSVNGSLTNGTGIGVQMTQPQSCWMQNVIVEEFDGAGGIGVYLRGSTTVGVGAAAAPHAWRSRFQHVIVATCKRPWVLENVDECTFDTCLAGCKTGESTETIAVEIIQGHNNRFVNLLCAGETNVTFRPNYKGIMLRNPTKGDNNGHTFYGAIAEGFNWCIYIEATLSFGHRFLSFVPSISAFTFWNGSDDGVTNVERGNNVIIEVQDFNHKVYTSTRADWSEPKSITTGSSPSVRQANVFAFVYAAPTNCDNFVDGVQGQTIICRLNANTTIRHLAGGTGNIRTSAGADIVGTANDMVQFTNVGGIWYQSSPVVLIP